jgi:hypothetical protein
LDFNAGTVGFKMFIGLNGSGWSNGLKQINNKQKCK